MPYTYPPPGAQAASAGTFITAAASIAAMAPSTNIGAASPVGGGGEDLPTTLARKINEDTRAFIRSIAEERGRNLEALEETVTQARSYSASEAVDKNVVDFIAEDLAELLDRLDEQTVQTAAGPRVLRTEGAEVREIGRSLLEGFLGVVSNPNIAFLLLNIGGIALLIELSAPGLTAPGIVGLIFLGLALVGLGQLPVNWVGIALLLFAMVLFFLEFQAPGLGIFGLGGVASLALGGILLFGNSVSGSDLPELSVRVSPWLAAAMAAVVGGLVLLFVYLARTTGSELASGAGSEKGLVGQLGVAVSDLAPSGTIRLGGDEWIATADLGILIPEGKEVRVTAVFGDVLKVTENVRE